MGGISSVENVIYTDVSAKGKKIEILEQGYAGATGLHTLIFTLDGTALVRFRIYDRYVTGKYEDLYPNQMITCQKDDSEWYYLTFGTETNKDVLMFHAEFTELHIECVEYELLSDTVTVKSENLSDS